MLLAGNGAPSLSAANAAIKGSKTVDEALVRGGVVVYLAEVALLALLDYETAVFWVPAFNGEYCSTLKLGNASDFSLVIGKFRIPSSRRLAAVFVH